MLSLQSSFVWVGRSCHVGCSEDDSNEVESRNEYVQLNANSFYLELNLATTHSNNLSRALLHENGPSTSGISIESNKHLFP